MLDVFERIVEQELDFGDVLQLVTEPLAQGAADEPVLVFEPLHHLAAFRVFYIVRSRNIRNSVFF